VKNRSEAQLHSFVNALDMFGIGVSWGGYENLVLPVEPQRTAVPWQGNGRMIRFSIGFEDTGSLKADLARALPLLD
jgi:cystathionine beta-lyase